MGSNFWQFNVLLFFFFFIKNIFLNLIGRNNKIYSLALHYKIIPLLIFSNLNGSHFESFRQILLIIPFYKVLWLLRFNVGQKLFNSDCFWFWIAKLHFRCTVRRCWRLKFAGFIIIMLFTSQTEPADQIPVL